MAEILPVPPAEAIIYEDDKLYACLASHPITRGHSVVVWKHGVADLHLLSDEDYSHLMSIVDRVRNALLAVLKIEKAYLMYLDEINHVHWHIVPRYKEKGFNVLSHDPSFLDDYTLGPVLKRHMS